ncbi:Myb-like DNA-binding protein [Nitzschia inconspicua]|uniref:Myb-like DNA-binding protein n=1 Tax=Nitzschia inconspicua TaxID=303405 RepID=A0A9K3PV27_9STRA|nr:Myb-like DNA-binding protein [Nitzschia inconspicua]KAG7360807.1 Myb-like DNA-binding protein [Nitzschia inconspicua]
MIEQTVNKSPASIDISAVSVNNGRKNDVISSISHRNTVTRNTIVPAAVETFQNEQRHDNITAAPNDNTAVDISSIRTIESFDMDPFHQHDGEIAAIRHHFFSGNDIVFHADSDSVFKSSLTMTKTTPARSLTSRVSFIREEVEEDARSADECPRVQPPSRRWAPEEDDLLHKVIVSRQQDSTGQDLFWVLISRDIFKGTRSPTECRMRFLEMLREFQAAPTIPPLSSPPPSEKAKFMYRTLSLPAITPCQSVKKHTSLKVVPEDHPWTQEEDLVIADNFRNLASKWPDVCSWLSHRTEESIKMRVRQIYAAAGQAKRQRALEKQRREEAERRKEQEEAELYRRLFEECGFAMVNSFFAEENWLNFDDSQPAAFEQEHAEYLQRGEEMEREVFSDDRWMEW